MPAGNQNIDGAGGLRSIEIDLSPTTPEAETPPPQAEPMQADRHNFRITDDDLGAGGAKAKYAMNIAAIRTLQDIESENRLATPDEQEILSRYVGWGGLPMAFDPDNTSWAKEYAELQSLLSPDEIYSARASTLNAHYTSPTVIKSMYETLGRLGFKGGNLLEPAMGVGNFFGLMPEGMEWLGYGSGIAGKFTEMEDMDNEGN